MPKYVLIREWKDGQVEVVDKSYNRDGRGPIYRAVETAMSDVTPIKGSTVYLATLKEVSRNGRRHKTD